MKELAPYSTSAGGPLILEELVYSPGRSNLKVTYPGTGPKVVSFVGSHFDVVPADPETWDKDPFQLTVEGTKLFGRGTTDCLGHVALITLLLRELGNTRPALKRGVVVLFIAGEEGGEKGVGVDCVVAAGKLEESKQGPVYWVDSADSQPCCGTAGMLSWSLRCQGRLFHSGFPHKGINSIELASEAVSFVQQRFYEDFPPHPSEEAYGFVTGSHMKPTQIECAKGSTNQICPETTAHGDIRLSPFYEVEDVVEAVETYVREFNEDLEHIHGRGPWSKFVLDENVKVNDNELRRGIIELKWPGGMDTFKLYAGVAVKLDSDGHKALVQACRESYASVVPFSVNGSLPLVKMMQSSGFDIQMCGFGLMSVYHGVNEYCSLTDMQKAYEVVLRILCLLEEAAA
jgi:acetylornithine deacetylase